ncbi:hypothetical protein L484_003986 [Morus notabilis]|uniref:Uncharacterized protein n=1 Tax=Morus notabilis TaxID=981085 RepID=W9QZU0_9ROSA|nr:hypothetical protein L484_003986 [Morus notabilis]
MSWWWWSPSVFRSTIFQWPDSIAAYLLPEGISNWDRQWLLRGWESLTLSIVDDVVWTVITAFESVALASMLCFFFLFCGCTI